MNNTTTNTTKSDSPMEPRPAERCQGCLDYLRDCICLECEYCGLTDCICEECHLCGETTNDFAVEGEDVYFDGDDFRICHDCFKNQQGL